MIVQDDAFITIQVPVQSKETASESSVKSPTQYPDTGTFASEPRSVGSDVYTADLLDH